MSFSRYAIKNNLSIKLLSDAKEVSRDLAGMKVLTKVRIFLMIVHASRSYHSGAKP